MRITAECGNIEQDEISNSSTTRKINIRGIDADTNHGVSNTFNPAGIPGALKVMEPSFNLSLAASTLWRTSPHLILATGERGEAQDAPWLHHSTGGDRWSSADNISFFTRGPSRPGTRNPAWKGSEDGVFWLLLEGLEDPALYIGLEDGRVKTAATEQEKGCVSEDAIMAEACIPLPLDGVRADGTPFEVKLDNGMGSVKLRWSTHKGAQNSKFH